MLLTTRDQIDDGLILQKKQRSNEQPKCWTEPFISKNIAVSPWGTESDSMWEWQNGAGYESLMQAVVDSVPSFTHGMAFIKCLFINCRRRQDCVDLLQVVH